MLRHDAPGESETSYFLAPPESLGDLSGVASLDFELRSTGGDYYDSGYDYLGDVVLEGAGSVAYATFANSHDGSWQAQSIPLSTEGGCWSVDAATLDQILADVTGLAIRAEFGVGSDDTWLAAFQMVVAEPE